MKPVLFATGLGKELDRAENMKVLFDAYPGEKRFMSMKDINYMTEAYSGKYGLQVIDIFPTNHPLKTIMIWHAIQGGKLIGLGQRGTYYNKSYADYMDYIIAAGHGGIDMFNQCTGVPRGRIYDLGMPRTDRYKRKKKGDGNTGYADKRVYLYAPTFRDFWDTPFPFIDWQWFDDNLTDDELIIIKAHPYGSQHDIQGETYRHIIAIDRMEPSVNYLFDCDVLITDYSSIMFDAYLLKKPVVLFEKNPGYVKTRGMYLKYPDEYCSRYATNEQVLLDHIRSANRLRTAEKRCLDYVADACDGHSCERICQFIKEQLEE